MGKIKRIICFAVMISVSLLSIAQNRNGREGLNREELIAKRNTFLTEKMALTAEETAVFIPLDNELLRKKFEVGRECHQYGRDLNSKSERTDEEYQKLLKCRQEVKEKREQLDREYLEKFKKILSAEKILKYQNADKEFFDNYIRNQN